jgi:hypothetical protein
MEQISSKSQGKPTGHTRPDSFFLDALVDPAAVFMDPSEVMDHPQLTDEEKRTVLLSWVRDELVIEHVARRATPNLGARSRIDAVIEALSHFDPSAAGEYLSAVASLRKGRPHRLSS